MKNIKGKDIASKGYLSKNAVFADLFNFFIYNGNPVVDPDKLTPLNTEQISILPEKDAAVIRYRDILKTATIMSDDKAAYLVLGIENQSQPDFIMPIRNMLYDVLEYDRQIKESGIRRGDFLKPVITLVLYLGAERWNTPKSLYELLPPLDEHIKPFINNYNVYIVEPAALSAEDFDKFQTDLGEILNFIKCSNDESAMQNLLASGKLKDLSREGGFFLKEVTHTNFDLNEGKEVGKEMCKAWDDAKINARKEGHAAGVIEGHAYGMIEGRREERMNAIKRMQESLKMTAEQAMDILGIPKEERTSYLSL